MRFLALASRNLKETYRDPVALGFLLAFPLLLMLVFGFAFGGETTPSFSIGVVDNDHSQLSKGFINNMLTNVPAFEVSIYDDANAALEDLKLGELKAYIVIPQGFGEQVTQNWQGDKVNIVLNITYDESDLIVSDQIISIIDATVRSFARIEIPVTIDAAPAHVETDITYVDFFAPGIIVFGLLVLIPTAANMMVSDREKGMITRLLTTPARPVDFILGYSLCLLLVAAAQILIIMVATWLFGLNMIGNPILAYLIFMLTGLCCIGIGMIISSLAKTQTQVAPITWLLAMPLAVLSGIWFPIEMMPVYLRGVAYAFPFAHAIDASRAILIRGVGLEAVGDDFLFLVGWSVVAFTIGIILFRRSMRS